MFFSSDECYICLVLCCISRIYGLRESDSMEQLFNASYCIALNAPESPPYLISLVLPYTCLIWFFYDALVLLVFLAMYFLFAFTGD